MNSDWIQVRYDSGVNWKGKWKWTCFHRESQITITEIEKVVREEYERKTLALGPEAVESEQ